MIFRSRQPEIRIPGSPLTPFVMRHAERLRDKVAIADAHSGRSYTYGELVDLIQQFASGLSRRGFGKGDVAAILSPNTPEYPIVFHGVASAGGVNTTLNPMYTASEIAFQLETSNARLLVTVPALIEKAREAASRAKVDEIIVIGGADGAAPLSSLLSPGRPSDVRIDPVSDAVALPYSSGTTGLSKGVVLTHQNLIANILQTAACLDISEDEKFIAFLPFFHIYGMNVIMSQALYHGATLVSMERFELESCLQAIQDFKVTRFFLVPPTVIRLANSQLVDNYDLSSVQRAFSGAAPLDAEIAETVSRRLGCRLSQGYGLTETGPVTTIVPDSVENPTPGSVGELVPNTECKVVDVETGEELGRNQDGEIWIRGPQVMAGYLNDLDATHNSIDRDGFFHSGDIGHIDDQDQWFIVDRLKELIKYKGFQVAPAELEALLLSHSKIADAAVIGVVDERGDESPKAFVVVNEPIEPEEVMEFVRARVAPHKKLRQCEIIDEIPKSATGKILRRVLRDRERAIKNSPE